MIGISADNNLFAVNRSRKEKPSNTLLDSERQSRGFMSSSCSGLSSELNYFTSHTYR
jgi:hypothetical protein